MYSYIYTYSSCVCYYEYNVSCILHQLLVSYTVHVFYTYLQKMGGLLYFRQVRIGRHLQTLRLSPRLDVAEFRFQSRAAYSGAVIGIRRNQSVEGPHVDEMEQVTK